MGELCGKLHFAVKTVGAEGVVDPGREHLDRHLAPEFQVGGEVHSCHAPSTQLPLERIPAFQRARYTLEDRIHHSATSAYGSRACRISSAVSQPALRVFATAFITASLSGFGTSF